LHPDARGRHQDLRAHRRRTLRRAINADVGAEGFSLGHRGQPRKGFARHGL
jgi:hypothetical protein